MPVSGAEFAFVILDVISIFKEETWVKRGLFEILRGKGGEGLVMGSSQLLVPRRRSQLEEDGLEAL